jgi:hypothetical protein
MLVTSSKANPKTTAGFFGWLGHGAEWYHGTDVSRQAATAAGHEDRRRRRHDTGGQLHFKNNSQEIESSNVALGVASVT